MTTHRISKVSPSAASTTTTTTEGAAIMTAAKATTAVAAAMQAAGIVNREELTSYFASPRLTGQMAWMLNNLAGQIATRIMKIANPARGMTPDAKLEIRGEIETMVNRLAFGIDHCGITDDTIEEAINQWASGGYSRPASDDDLSQISDALGLSLEQAKATAEANRHNRTNWLAVRRAGLAAPMFSQIMRQLEKATPTEPTTEEIEQAIAKVYPNAVLWGDYAEATLIRADSIYYTGKSPEVPQLDGANAVKAQRIREDLQRQQQAKAQADADALYNFDIDNMSHNEAA